EPQGWLPPRGRHVAQLHQMALADQLLQVGDLEARALQRKLRLSPPLAERPPLLAGLAHLFVAASEPLLRLVVQRPRPAQLPAQPFGVGEQLAHLLPAATASRDACSSRETSKRPLRSCSTSWCRTWSRWAIRVSSSCSRATSRSSRSCESSSSRSSWSSRLTWVSAACTRAVSCSTRWFVRKRRASSPCTVSASSWTSRRLWSSPSATPSSAPPETTPSLSTTSPSADTKVREPGFRAQSASAVASVSQRKTSARR